MSISFAAHLSNGILLIEPNMAKHLHIVKTKTNAAWKQTPCAEHSRKNEKWRMKNEEWRVKSEKSILELYGEDLSD
jgi:hypothetical protein